MGRTLRTVASETARVQGDIEEEYRRTAVFADELVLEWEDASSSLSSSSAPPPSARIWERVSVVVRQPYIHLHIHCHSSL